MFAAKITKIVSHAKSLVERLFDIKGNREVREEAFYKVLDMYSTSFNRTRALMWFENVPAMLIWRGDNTFWLGDKKSRHFSPETIADFISLMQSYGHDLKINRANNPIDMFEAGTTLQKPVNLRYLL